MEDNECQMIQGKEVMASRFAVDDLIALAPPPEWRIDAGSPVLWHEVESELGIELPYDYKLVTNIYGTGEFNDLFYLFNPFSCSDGMNLLHHALDRLDSSRRSSCLQMYRESMSMLPEDCPFATFPQPGGLLPLGGDTNGGYAFWLTEGESGDWPLVLYTHGFHSFERHYMPVVDFLVLWLSGELPDCFEGAGGHFVNRTDPVFRNHWKGPTADTVRL